MAGACCFTARAHEHCTARRCALLVFALVAVCGAAFTLLSDLVLVKQLHAHVWEAERPEGHATAQPYTRPRLRQPAASLCRPVEVPDKPYLAVVSVFKDEADVMEEWLEHHLWQGVDHFYLVDNGSDDGFEAVVAAYAACVTVVRDDLKHAQVRLLNAHLLSLVKERARWVMGIDMDEYMYARPATGFSTVADTLAHVDRTAPHVTTVRVRWLLFGSSGLDKQPASVRESFVRSNDAYHIRTKWIARAGALVELGVHAPVVSVPDELDERLQHVAWFGGAQLAPAPLDEGLLRLNHYAIMSWERFQAVKMTRGDVASQKYESVRDRGYFNRYDQASSAMRNLELQALVRHARAVHCRGQEMEYACAASVGGGASVAAVAVAVVVRSATEVSHAHVVEWGKHHVWQAGAVVVVDATPHGDSPVSHWLEPYHGCVTVMRGTPAASDAAVLDPLRPRLASLATWVGVLRWDEFVLARRRHGFSTLRDVLVHVSLADPEQWYIRVRPTGFPAAPAPASATGAVRVSALDSTGLLRCSAVVFQRMDVSLSFSTELRLVDGAAMDARLLPLAPAVVYDRHDAVIAVHKYGPGAMEPAGRCGTQTQPTSAAPSAAGGANARGDGAAAGLRGATADAATAAAAAAAAAHAAPPQPNHEMQMRVMWDRAVHCRVPVLAQMAGA